MIIEYQELSKIRGGTSITATFLSSFARMISSIYDVGNNLGSSIRRIVEKRMCSY